MQNELILELQIELKNAEQSKTDARCDGDQDAINHWNEYIEELEQQIEELY